MKYLSHALLALMAIVSAPYSFTQNQKDTTHQINTLCEQWVTNNESLVHKLLDSKGELTSSDLEKLSNLLCAIEQIEEELIRSGLNPFEVRLHSLNIGASVLRKHLTDEQRMLLCHILETDNPELDGQLEEAIAFLLTQPPETRSNQTNAPELDYLLFMYCMRKQLA